MSGRSSHRRGVRVGLLLALTSTLFASLLVLSSSALAGGDNSDNAKLCHKHGWMNLVRSDGSAFEGQGDCVSYGAQGGTLVPSSTTTCTAGSEDFSGDARYSTPTEFSGGTIDTGGAIAVVGDNWTSTTLTPGTHLLFSGSLVSSSQLSFTNAVGSVQLDAQPNDAFYDITLTAYDAADTPVGTETATPGGFGAATLSVTSATDNIDHFTVSTTDPFQFGVGFTNIVWACN
jgi:hypothetical protein